MTHTDILVIGAGAAGLSAATAAAAGGARVTLLDYAPSYGGVLPQCAHHGFGAGLDGPAYARGLWQKLPRTVEVRFEATVRAISSARMATVQSAGGRSTLSFDALVLATGCREVPVGALNICGTRPRGVYTAGEMQALMNLDGCVPPAPAVILGSGDIGLIMAAQLAGAGIPVTLLEKRETCSALLRNQAVLAHPLVTFYNKTTITEICGEPALSSVVLADGREISAHTLLIACGLRPERTLTESLGTPPWLFLAGNCRRVQRMIETVVQDGQKAGCAAYEYWRKHS